VRGNVGGDSWQQRARRFAVSVSLVDIQPGAGASNPGDLVNVSGELLFAANDSVHGRELWKAVP
jgi:hypothetical protein